MCRFHEIAESAIRPTAQDLKTGRVSAADYFNKLVNGNFLSLPDAASVEDKIDCCISTICALVKEYNLDFVCEGVAAQPHTFQRKHLAAFGEYLELPVRALSVLLTRLRLLGLRGPNYYFQRMLDVYLEQRATKVANLDNRPVLVMYLVTALEAHRLWQYRQEHSRPIPWRLKVTKKGRVKLEYSCWYGKIGRKRDANPPQPRLFRFEYRVSIPLSHTTSDSLREFIIGNQTPVKI